MTKARLLDDDEEEQEFGPTIVVNEEFAKRFEYNKRREELHRLQEKHPELAARLARQAAAETARAARQAAGGSAAAYEDEEEDEESSSDDDDDEELLENDDTDKVLETLVRIKRKDPVVYQKDVYLFPDKPAAAAAAAEGERAAADKKDKGSSKPVYLRTVIAKQALEGGAASSDDEDDDEQDEGIPKQPVDHSYAAEQQELKKAFLQAAEQALDEQEGEYAAAKGLIKKQKQKLAAAAADGDGDAAGGAGKEQQVNQLLDEYFGRDAELTEADAFLKSYLANKAWKEPTDRPDGAGGSRKRLRGMGDDDSSSSSGSGSESGDEGGDRQGGVAVDEEEDEQFLEEVDRFEAAYNFRFEEPNSHRIQSFPRVIEDSVRRPDERRKRQRQAKAERKAAEQEELEAELRRLKNLKKEEINDMLARIEKEAGIQPAAKPAAAAAAGKSAKTSSSGSDKGGAKFAGLLDELLEGDFDPEEYDRRMAEAFDDDYYEGEEDAHELFGDAEEELADEADVEAVTDPDSANAASSFAALRQKLKQQRQQQGSDDADDAQAYEDADQRGGPSDDEGPDESVEEGSEGEGVGNGSKAEWAAKHAEQRSQLQRLLEDYYKLDYEDNIGGLACRFKYREVPAESFGLTDEDVLALSDKQLNQIAGLRLLAPYREDNKRLRPNYKALQSIKGEAAAAAALRRHKREREKLKEKQKKQQPKRQQGDGHQPQQQQQQQQQDRHSGKGKRPQQQGQTKKMFGQQGQRGQHHQQHQQQHRHKQQHHQQQKPFAEMTAEEKQAARLASYAKLTLKPSKQAQQQAEGPAGTAAGGAGKGSKKRRAEQQQGVEGGEKQKRKKQKGPAVQPGRLAAAGVQLEAPLTKAQKKNLLRALKRKEKQGQGKQPAAEV